MPNVEKSQVPTEPQNVRTDADGWAHEQHVKDPKRYTEKGATDRVTELQGLGYVAKPVEVEDGTDGWHEVHFRKPTRL